MPDRRRPPAALKTFLEPYGPGIARLFFAARGAVLDAAPMANELIYDAYNAVTVAYSFTERLKEAFCHVAAYRDHVNLGFNRGAALADPERLLVGTGTSIRHVRISAPEDLERAAVRRVIVAAAEEGLARGGGAPARARAIVMAVYGKKRRPDAGAVTRRRAGPVRPRRP